jgi:hypothetical protein
LDLDRMLVREAARANNSVIGRPLAALAERIGGPSTAASLNILCTAFLGFTITYSIYALGGPWAALPTGAFTLLLISFISFAILSANSGAGRKAARKPLAFAIIFSLPFGLLSLPLLSSLSPLRAGSSLEGLRKA